MLLNTIYQVFIAYIYNTILMVQVRPEGFSDIHFVWIFVLAYIPRCLAA